jgi:hypothetical protein
MPFLYSGPSMTDFVNTHDRGALQTAFAGLPTPKPGMLIQSGRLGLKVVKPLLRGLELDAVDRMLGGLAKDRAFERAAHQWLDPASPWTIATLGACQESVGLKKLSKRAFAEGVRHVCEQLKQRAPTLSRHIDKRVAELEFVDNAINYLIPELELYQRDVLDAAMRAATQQALSATDANQVLKDILPAIAAKCREVLDPEHGTSEQVFTNTNFMAIVELNQSVRVRDVPKKLGMFGDQPAAHRAAKLWKDLDRKTERVFVVITDTDNDRHRGFWLPDVIEDNRTIPGAATAMQARRPDAVFADDLPTLGVGGRATKDQWELYMTDKTEEGFRDEMFISLPIFGRASRKGDPKKAGVVNVNCGPGSYWPRAYSAEWLRLAAAAAGPLLSLAWHAYAVQHAALNATPDLFRTNPFVYALPSKLAKTRLLEAAEVFDEEREDQSRTTAS